MTIAWTTDSDGAWMCSTISGRRWPVTGRNVAVVTVWRKLWSRGALYLHSSRIVESHPVSG